MPWGWARVLNRFGGGGPKYAANPGLTPNFRSSLTEIGCLSQGLPHGIRSRVRRVPKAVKHPAVTPGCATLLTWIKGGVAPMRLTFASLVAFAMLAAVGGAQSKPAKTLDIYFIDTEGGLAALYVSPAGESLLIDTGNPGGRDTDRIMEVVNTAGIQQIDHMILTHYHVDHVGGLQELAKRIPIKHFIDH